MRSLRLLACLGILAGLTAAAPLPVAHPLVGKWSIEYERGRRMNNGETESIMGKETLEIAERGDSLVGTFTNEAPAGMPAPTAVVIAGKGAGNAATLKSSSTSTVNINGESRTISISMTWELKAEGDAVTGTMTRLIADMPSMGAPTPVRGTRVK